MSNTAIDSEEESNISNTINSESIVGIPSKSQNRERKRWSFNGNIKPNLVEDSNVKDAARRLSEQRDIDGVHKEIDPYHISPAQLYSTESGRLFHAGKICIILVGLPGRGKTHLTVSLTRYLRWLGVKTHSFHIGDYRRAKSQDVPQDFFIPKPNTEQASSIRSKIINDCLNDIMNFFNNDKGQVAIYDAVNALSTDRLDLHKTLTKLNIQTLFIESLVTNDAIIAKNIVSAAKSSPDYTKWDYQEAVNDYTNRILTTQPYYEEMGEKMLSYIKFINFGDRIILNNSHYGYLINKVVFFLMNSRIKSGSVFFARCVNNKLDYKSDPPLDEKGDRYAKAITKTVTNYLMKMKGEDYFERLNAKDRYAKQLSLDTRQPSLGADGIDEDSFVIWTSAKRRTIETTKYFREKNIKIRHRVQLSQKNPGIVGGMSDKEISEKYPEEYQNYNQDPYHYRFSRAESYHDLAIKIEPLILEMERMSGDVLIIADETVLRVFYAYLMAFSCYDIPALHFSNDEIIEIKFNAYANVANRIKVENV